MWVECTRKTVFLSSFVLLCVVKLSTCATLSLNEQKRYKHLIEGQGLYSTDDDVEILTASNFNKKLYGKPNAWIIEFYNSWCGFCQRFAPSWKALATDIRGWKSVVAVGAIDCSDDDNSAICRDFEIMGYPTLRYFHENYQPGTFGEDVQKGDDVHSHRRHLVGKLVEEQSAGRARMLPNLLPYTQADADHFFDGLPQEKQYVFVVFEGQNTIFGAQVALDYINLPSIAIRYTDNTELQQKLGVTNPPKMVVFKRNGESHQFQDSFNTRDEIRDAIRKYLSDEGVQLPAEPMKKDIYTGKWVEIEVPDMQSLMEAREFQQLKERVKKMGDVVFQMDLETALRYSLRHEVSTVKSITGEKLTALRAYLQVLSKYFPFGRNGKRFLEELTSIALTRNSIDGSEIAGKLDIAEQEDQKVFSSPKQWLGCRGSSPEKRGFPCGLWKMFHYLTVNAAEHGDAEPREVLDAMLGYVKNFFGCADCSRHFQEMAVEKDLNGVSSLESSVLWLWMAHNTVNKRLAGDATEDAEFPKVQFPTSERCPLCRNTDGSWNYPEVLTYLKSVYSAINVRYIGSDTRVLHLGLDGSSGASSFTSSPLDSSMCFLLYVASFSLLLVLIRMFLKRGYRKKAYVHDLLGKV